MSLAIVQAGAAGSVGSVVPGVTFGMAPTLGNLLIATLMQEDFAYVPNPSAGWQLLQFFHSGISGLIEATYFKYCGAGESLTQQPSLEFDINGWAVTIWEISGVSGIISQDFAEAKTSLPTDYPGTSAAPASFTNAISNELLLLGSENGNVGLVTLSISGGGTWSADAGPAFGSNQGYNQTAYGWSQFFATAGNAVNPTLTSSGGNRFFVSYLGLTTDAPTGPPQLVQSVSSGILTVVAPFATLPKAPTNGNLLVAWCYFNAAGGAPAPNTGAGWQLDTSSRQTTSGFDNYLAVYYKYAGVGESATQTPETVNHNAWDITIWEVSGVTGSWATDHVATTLAAATSPATLTPSTTTTANNELALVGYASGVTGSGGVQADTGVQHGAYYQTGGGGYGHAAGAWHFLEPTLGAMIAPVFNTGGGASANQCWSVIVELKTGTATGGTGNADLSTVAVTGPGASAFEAITANAGLATISVTGPGASGVGGATASAALPTITVTGLQVVGLGSGAQASQAVAMALAEVIPADRASQAASLVLANPGPPPDRASGVVGLILGEVIPGDRLSEVALLVLVDAEPCVTHRCDIWLFTRKDGVELAFTSHDMDVPFMGHTAKACGSLTPGATEQSADVASVGSLTLQGIINHSDIQEADLYAGAYDDALVEVWRVSWDRAIPETPVRLAAGWIGKVEHGEAGWTVEILGPAARLAQQSITEVFTPSCRWVFGSPQCGVDLYFYEQAAVAILSPDRSTIFADVDDPHLSAQWNNGSILFTSGRNAGYVIETKTVDFTSGLIRTWLPAPYPVGPGDTFLLRPGCDKSKVACQLYSNYINFGGFADIAGQDAIVQLPQANY